MLSELHEPIVALLDRAGLRTAFAAEPLFGGNNRVYRLHCGGGDVVLKVYFHDDADRRPRLAREFAFLDFVWRHGVRSVPQPLAQDVERNLGLYGFVAGRKLLPGEVGEREISAALDFVIALDRLKHEAGAGELIDGSEACYTIAAHLDVVERRIARLADIDTRLPVHSAALEFCRGPLRDAWQAVKANANAAARDLGMALDTALPPADRCISPSDFGFHNALKNDSGDICFIDFEYAGWDDPAKLVGDFFNQVAVPVPREHYAAFADGIARLARDPAWQRQRFDLVLPVYRLKWICIVLNDFLRAGDSRRSFSGDEDVETRKRRQLDRARAMLRRIDGDGQNAP